MYIEPTSRGILTAIFRQKYKFITMLFVVMLGSEAYIRLSTPLFESRGSILVKFGADAKPDVSLNGRQTTSDSYEHKEILESNIQILQSHDLLMPLVKEFGPEVLYPKLSKMRARPETRVEAAIALLMKRDLSVKATPMTNIIEVKVLNQDPFVAQGFSKQLLARFITRQSEVYNKPQTDFINEQLKRASDELESAQQKLKDFKEKTGLSSLEEEQSQLLQAKSETQSVALNNITETQTKLNELKIREAQLLTTYRPDSFPVKQLRESIAITERQLLKLQIDFKASTGFKSLDPAPEFQTAPKYRKTTNAIAEHIEDIDQRISEIERQRSQYNDLQRQVQIHEENYKSYLARLEEARANSVLNEQKITRITMLDEANLPSRSLQRDALFIRVLSMLAGCLAALGGVILVEALDQRFVVPEQVVRTLRIPVLSTFSLVHKR